MASPEQVSVPPVDEAEGSQLLSVNGLNAGYGKRQVIFDVSLRLLEGEVITLLGHNGAGKTTTIKSIFGYLRPTDGRVEFNGEDVTGSTCARNVRRGMTFIPAEHFVFSDLTVLDNLRLGAIAARSKTPDRERLERIFAMFPILETRLSQLAGTMSGGEQRMLSLGIGLMSEPRLMLLDEPSLGLSPLYVGQIMDAIRSLATEESVSVVLLEQNVSHALRVADRVYVMRSGRVILEESAHEMEARGHWWDLF